MPYTWYGGGPRPRRHCVKSGPSSAHVYCGQTAGWIKMPIGTKVALDPGHIVLDVDPASPPEKGHTPQISAHVCCGPFCSQIVAHVSYSWALVWASPYPVTFLSVLSVMMLCCGQTVGWIKMKLGVEVGLRSGHIVFDGDPASGIAKAGEGGRPPPPQRPPIIFLCFILITSTTLLFVD